MDTTQNMYLYAYAFCFSDMLFSLFDNVTISDWIRVFGFIIKNQIMRVEHWLSELQMISALLCSVAY